MSSSDKVMTSRFSVSMASLADSDFIRLLKLSVLLSSFSLTSFPLLSVVGLLIGHGSIEEESCSEKRTKPNKDTHQPHRVNTQVLIQKDALSCNREQKEHENSYCRRSHQDKPEKMLGFHRGKRSSLGCSIKGMSARYLRSV